MTASLPSNDGDARITFGLDCPSNYAGELGFESAIQIQGRHWDGDHTHPIVISVAGIWLSVADLRKLRDHVIGWNSLPLDQMDPSLLDGIFDLATLPGQKACLSFGPTSNVISGMNPLVSILVDAGPLSSRYCFVTDQSCLALFAEELSNAIKSQT